MKHFIVAPLYLITKDLANKIRELKDEELTIIITDDVNPIVPLDTRINWLRRTFVGQKFDIESLIQNDESNEFQGAVLNTINKLRDGKEYTGYVFLTQGNHEDNTFEDFEKNEIAPPLEADLVEVCDELFFKRFSDEVAYVYRNKADDEIAEEDIIQVIAYFEDEGIKYFGFIDVYSHYGFLRTLEMEIPKFTKVADINKILNNFVPHYFQGKVIGSPKLLGWVRDENQYLVGIEKPENLDMQGEFGARLFLDDGRDIVFIPQESLKLSDDTYMHWLANRAEEAFHEE